MTALDVFTYGEQPVRTVLVDGEPWFVAADVCMQIGISKPRDATAQLDADERASMAVDTLGGQQQMTVVSEAGVYSLMLISRSPLVQPFKRWLTHEVLPAIRKTGTYSVELAKPELTREQRLAYAVLEAADTIKEQDARIAQLLPSAEAWDALAADDGRDLSVREAAQVLTRDHGVSIGQNRLFDYLRGIGWLDQKNGPYQSQIDNGRLSRKVSDYTDDYGQRFVKIQPRVTTKGLAELHKRLTKPLQLISSA